MRLAGKTAIITGASKGIGVHMAHRFAEEGAQVVIAARSEKEGEQVAADIRDKGGSALFVRTDIERDEDCDAVVRRAVEEFGGLHILVNNAAPTEAMAAGEEKPLVGQSTAEFDHIMRVGLYGAVFMCRSAIPAMADVGGGSIVNISSLAAVVGVGGLSAYSCAKAGVHALTRQVAVDYAHQNIRCNGIIVGAILTGTTADLVINFPAAREALENAVLTPRMGEPNDIAEAAIYLASDAAGFIDGVMLPVDGGFLAKAVLPDLSEVLRAAQQ